MNAPPLLQKIALSLLTVGICLVAGLVIPLTLTWTTVGAEADRQAVLEGVMWVGAILLIFGFSGLGIWQIWRNHYLLGVGIAIGSWPIALIYLILSDVLVGIILFLQGK
ncbi:hypothetical protein GlitD10_1428 [Gloeomargarita lithophora Alchichica-D10]|uniref:Uncharacterized protein n=1 Tax=Gloeomargarita lithophora Alchichica-D10 TaxID=1188229 RepID=A0A1J0ACT7_9CYAN|nr:hypothetical protein [Gloeomargarita lithophora]APB33749.1 hypothetical protein GlitD10_1428 [Gloeomargarita lithophora Alchichica-D10]